ncbi:hypothetical protein D3C75_671890 [compost metagenome]
MQRTVENMEASDDRLQAVLEQQQSCRLWSEADREDVILRKTHLFRLIRTQEPLYCSFGLRIGRNWPNNGLCVRLI